MSYSLHNPQHWGTDGITPPPPGPWSNLRWTVRAPPCAAGSQLWLSADGHHTFDRCIGSASSTRTNDKCCGKKKWCMQLDMVTTWRRKRAPGVERKGSCSSSEITPGSTTHHHRPEMKNQLRPCRRCCDTFVKLLIVSWFSLMLRVDGMDEGGKSD